MPVKSKADIRAEKLLPGNQDFTSITNDIAGVPEQKKTPIQWWLLFGFALSLLAIFVGSVGFLIWEGTGVNEIGRRADTNEIVIRIDEKYFRPTEVSTLLGDPTFAKNKLGWIPKTTLEELVSEMVKVDKEEAQKDLLLAKSGFNINSSNEQPPNI